MSGSIRLRQPEMSRGSLNWTGLVLQEGVEAEWIFHSQRIFKTEIKYSETYELVDDKTADVGTRWG